MATRLEAIASRLEAIATRVKAIALRLEAIASGLEAIASRLEAMASSRLEAIATRVELRLERWRPFLLDCMVFKNISQDLLKGRDTRCLQALQRSCFELVKWWYPGAPLP